MGATSERVADSPRRVFLFGLALAALGAAAYANTFHVPLLLDDAVTLGGQAAPGFASPVAGRPVLEWSFALNRRWSGSAVWSYHGVNLAIHLAAALVLFGLVRRVGLVAAGGAHPGGREDRSQLTFAATVAGIWLLHPLQTESVTYLSQRAESLMGLFYLLTLYCHVRGWRSAAVAFCWLGMGTKETMVTAPLAVVLIDWAGFAAPGSRGQRPRRQQGRYLAALFGSWILLGWLIVRSHLGERHVGFGTGVGPAHYLLTECGAIAHYVQLAIWPRPLVFDYGFEVLRRWDGWNWAGLVLALGGLAAIALSWRRHRSVACLMALFFLLLAPTSSVVPIALSPIAESRMYLPLIPLVVLAVLAARRWQWLLGAVPLLLGVLTFQRNHTYRSAEAIWTDTVAKAPGNSRAQNNAGLALAEQPSGQTAAIEHYQAALRINPDYAEADNNLGLVLADQPGRADEAARYYEAALRLQPNFVEARNNYGTLLARRLHRPDAAIAQFRAALALRPDFPEAHNNLGLTLLGQAGHETEAQAEFEAALRLKPDYPAARQNLAAAENERGNAVLREPGRLAEAIGDYEAALRDDPGLYGAHYNVALAYAEQGRFPEAIRHMETAARLAPDNPDIREMLARMRAAAR